MEIRNRIKALEYIHTRDLVAHPGNWREHPKAQADALLGILQEVGIAGALLAYRSERQGGALVVIDGHLRKDAAPTKWPVLVLDVTDEEADYLLATHDPLAAMATADAGALDALLSSVNSGEAAVQAMLAELAESAGLYPPTEDESDAEPQIDRAEELREQWGVEPGQMWRLPSRTPGQEHRLICGDCTDAAVVERVMGGEKATLAPVDPPYNVGFDYDGETVDDAKSIQAFEAFSRAWFTVCQSVSERQIVTPGCYNLAWWLRWFDAYHWAPWTKTNSMTNGKTSRFWCWEPILFFGEKWPRRRSNDVFDFPIGEQGGVANHPCPKPLKMWADLIDNYSEPADVIYEAFNGSGTTIIAAENLSRQCRAVEISPAYVAVALQRYADAFGIEPELITDGD